MFTDKHILIIDDSEAILMVVKTMLSRMGFERLTTMTSAQKALQLVSRAPDDIYMVLTDLRMPGFDGLDVLRRLGEIKFAGAVAIISEMDKRIINLAADIAKNHQLHLIGCISKPIQQDDLAALVQKAGEMLSQKWDESSLLSEETILQALENNWVVPYFQPKVNFTTMRVESVEALARIVLPGEVNAVRPCRFLPTVMKAGLIDSLTGRILDVAAKEFSTIKGMLGDDVKLGLNLSPDELENLSLAGIIEAVWQQHGHRNSELILELTEEEAIQNNRQLECLNRLRLKDFGLSLDDFGTGFTNINQLRNLPYTEVKIDRSLIINIHRDSFCQAIVTSLADIASQLNITLVAEGIEHISELNFLVQKYPNLVLQGYLISMPRPTATLAAWYRSWQRQFGATSDSMPQD
ncbi:EAL domain-containing response regulator [Shewanella sp. JM162201]|uniref:EAL domain-containing response regulator n=1 Tax=Shewanella jiangmenensis TaxID=2837387 RepID=A0ABS5V2F3_9GAMM|nr:EAL domain-containing response regulator [Shewanella jiangmenensis]MBT1444639.1 EAL domain-containing response regulator [Shewanella jiangmenensis]